MTTEQVRTRYDWSCIDPSTAVIETVAAATGREPTSFGPLYESVDPDALDALVTADKVPVGDPSLAVSFTFADQHVTVRASGELIVRTDELGRSTG